MQMERRTLARARLALREAIGGWLFDPNVMLIDFGWPEHGGQIVEEEPHIRVHVKEKYTRGPQLEAAIELGRTGGEIPDWIGGFRVDRPEATYRLHQWLGGWWRRRRKDARATRADPMRGGISISDQYRNSFGTLGGLVVDRATGREMLLSNWHVLAGDWRARPRRRIYQPGRRDGGTRADTIAVLTRDAMSANLDAAVARLTHSRPLTKDQLELGSVRGVGRAELGMGVVKSGRRTRITHGRVTAIEGTAKMRYRGVERMIRNVVTIEPRRSFEQVSAGGDSGSWWLDEETMQAIGLHFAGSDRPERALAIDMESVLHALNVDIVT
jgi:endonuclease G